MDDNLSSYEIFTENEINLFDNSVATHILSFVEASLQIRKSFILFKFDDTKHYNLIVKNIYKNITYNWRPQ